MKTTRFLSHLTVLAPLGLALLAGCSDARPITQVDVPAGPSHYITPGGDPALTDPTDSTAPTDPYASSSACPTPILSATRPDGSQAGYSSPTAGQLYTYNANGSGCIIGAWSASNSNVTITGSGNRVQLQVKSNISSFTLTVYSGGSPYSYNIAVGQPAILFTNTATVGVTGSTSLSFTAYESGGSYVIPPSVWPPAPVFTSANTAIATVAEGARTSTGTTAVVSGRSVGNTTVQVSYLGQTKIAYITVSGVGVTSVTVSPDPTTVRVTTTAQLTATAKDASGNPITGRPVTWSSANPSIATVSSSGVVTGVAEGTTTVRATVDGVVGSATVTVAPPLAPPPCRDCTTPWLPTGITVTQ